MENRIFVGTKSDTSRLFQDVIGEGKLGTQKNLVSSLHISRGNFWRYYTQDRLMPKKMFEFLLQFLSKTKQEEYRSISSQKPGNWGAQKGAMVTHKKYPNHIVKARSIANFNNRKRAETRFDLNQPLTTELAEFLGAFSGDGYTNNKKSHYTIGFAGDSRLDLNYYNSKIIPITQKLFNIEKGHFRIEGNCMWINFYSLALHKLIVDRFKMPAGEKWDKVLIPDEVMQSKIEHKTAFVRGILDTDGCVFFDSRPIYKEPYMRVDITMVNVPILTQIKQVLDEVGIESQVLGNGKHLHVTSKENVRKFLEIVGSSNERHISKVRKKYADFDEWNPARIPQP